MANDQNGNETNLGEWLVRELINKATTTIMIGSIPATSALEIHNTADIRMVENDSIEMTPGVIEDLRELTTGTATIVIGDARARVQKVGSTSVRTSAPREVVVTRRMTPTASEVIEVETAALHGTNTTDMVSKTSDTLVVFVKAATMTTVPTLARMDIADVETNRKIVTGSERDGKNTDNVTRIVDQGNTADIMIARREQSGI